MDLHPTPFPGKLRQMANVTKKDKVENKSSKESNIVPARYRQKRAFGTSRCTNAVIEKPLSKPSAAKTWQPLKPSGKVLNPAKKNGLTVESKKTPPNAVKGSPQKARAQTNRPSVHFKEPLQDGLRTPLSAIKPMALGTPYHSAENCSKCRFDRLESSPYWLAQIKLAESVGKHFISAAFFRLALECQAEPHRTLKSEVKRYMARHGSIARGTVWEDVCRAYGLSNEEANGSATGLDNAPSVVKNGDFISNIPGQINNEINKDTILECDISDTPKKIAEETMIKVSNSSVELNDDTGENALADIIDGLGSQNGIRQTANASEPSPPKVSSCDVIIIPQSDTQKPIEGDVSQKKSSCKKVGTRLGFSSNDSSSTRKGNHGPQKSVDKDLRTLNKAAMVSKNVSGELSGEKGVRKSRTSQPKSKDNAEEKHTSP